MAPCARCSGSSGSGTSFFNAPEEDFDKDLSKEEQESQALGVVDSMKGELDYMRRDGLL